MQSFRWVFQSIALGNKSIELDDKILNIKAQLKLITFLYQWIAVSQVECPR